MKKVFVLLSFCPFVPSYGNCLTNDISKNNDCIGAK